MPRSRSRVCLQDGLKLDLNSLARKGFVQRGCYSGVRGIRWTHSYLGGSRISADFCRSKRRVIGLAETGGRPQPVYFAGGSAETLRRSSVVFCLPLHRPASFCPVAPSGCEALLQPSSVGTPGRVCVAIPRPRQPSPSWKIQTQYTAMCDRRARSHPGSASLATPAVAPTPSMH